MWDDGVAPETIMDFDAPHVSTGKALRHLGIAFSGFVALMGIVWLYDPKSLRPAVGARSIRNSTMSALDRMENELGHGSVGLSQ